MPPNSRKRAPTYIPPGQFQFLELPAELRVQVYKYLIPNGLAIDLSNMANTPYKVVRWRPFDRKPYEDGSGRYVWTVGGMVKSWKRATMGLFLVSHLVSHEAKAVLYGMNEYTITIDAKTRATASLSTPSVFGPLGLPHRVALLRDLRCIHLCITPDCFSGAYWSYRRHRGRLELFAKIMKEHAEDTQQRSLLKELKIEYCVPSTSYGWVPSENAVLRGMFCLEALVPLRGIESVEILGTVAVWFATCLVLCLQGTGGDVKKMVYPEIEAKPVAPKARRKVGKIRFVKPKRKETVVVESGGTWFMPELDWREFAERNGVVVQDGEIELFADRVRKEVGTMDPTTWRESWGGRPLGARR